MFRDFIMGSKNISTLHQIYAPWKEHVGEFIGGSKDSKNIYMESLPMVTIRPPSNGDTHVEIEN